MPACLAWPFVLEWLLIVFRPSTITLSSLGKAFRTLPFFPLSLPAMTRTVSFFLIFILQYLWSQRYNLHKILFPEFPGYRTKNTSALGIIFLIQNHCSIVIKSDKGTILTMIRPGH